MVFQDAVEECGKCSIAPTLSKDGVEECGRSSIAPTLSMAGAMNGVTITGSVLDFCQDAFQGTFEAQGTNDQGACAIHSVFGTIDYLGQYFCIDARQFLGDSLGHSCTNKCIPHFVIWAILNPKNIKKILEQNPHIATKLKNSPNCSWNLQISGLGTSKLIYVGSDNLKIYIKLQKDLSKHG